MAIRKIITYPQDEELLRKVSKPVTEFDDRLADLLLDLKETMHHAKGAGLSAIQVGVLKRVCVVDVGKRHLEFINPKIIKQSGVNRIKEEGCLSIPNVWEIVKRPNKITVVYQDRNGNQHEDNFSGYEAKAICHECDHMDGILFIDRVEKK